MCVPFFQPGVSYHVRAGLWWKPAQLCVGPSLHAKKLRDLELKAGHKAVRGQKGAAHAYNIKSHREEERRWVEQARRPMPASSPAGTHEGSRRYARAPQTRCDDEDCAAGLPPHALLFATRWGAPLKRRDLQGSCSGG